MGAVHLCPFLNQNHEDESKGGGGWGISQLTYSLENVCY